MIERAELRGMAEEIRRVVNDVADWDGMDGDYGLEFFLFCGKSIIFAYASEAQASGGCSWDCPCEDCDACQCPKHWWEVGKDYTWGGPYSLAERVFSRECITEIEDFANQMVYAYHKVYALYQRCLGETFGADWKKVIKTVKCEDGTVTGMSCEKLKACLTRMEKLIKIYAKKATHYKASTFSNAIRAARNSVLFGIEIKDAVTATTEDVLFAIRTENPLETLDEIKAEKARQKREEKKLEDSGFYFSDPIAGEDMAAYYSRLLSALRFKYDCEFRIMAKPNVA